MLKKKHWQVIAGSIIVIAALAIVLPALISLVFGIGRLIITIWLIILVASAVSILQVKYKQKQLKPIKPNNYINVDEK